jgi:hypothetical protein
VDSASASKALTPRPSHTNRTSTCWVQCEAVAPASSMEAARAAAPKGPGARAQARKCPRKVPGCGLRNRARLGPVARHACWMAMTPVPDSSRPGLARRSVRVPGARGPPVPGGGLARAAAVWWSTYAMRASRWARVCRRKSGPGRELARVMSLLEWAPVTRAREPTRVMSLLGWAPVTRAREPTRAMSQLGRTPMRSERAWAILPLEQMAVMPGRAPKRVTSVLERMPMMTACERKPAMLLAERARRRPELQRVGVLAPRPYVPSVLRSAGLVGYLRWRAQWWRTFLWRLWR